jgi:hypothetical protein
MRLLLYYRSVTRFWQVTLIARGWLSGSQSCRFSCSLYLVTQRFNTFGRRRNNPPYGRGQR